LLSDELSLAADQNKDMQNRIDCFDIVIFPLLADLCEVDQKADAIGSGETNLRACGLVTKVFLCFAPVLVKHKEFNRIWINTLDVIGKMLVLWDDSRMVHIKEGILESLKNVLLVLISDNILHQTGLPGEGTDKSSLWNVTWERVTRIFPPMKAELLENHSATKVTTGRIPKEIKSE
jgi:hypothetical protein